MATPPGPAWAHKPAARVPAWGALPSAVPSSRNPPPLGGQADLLHLVSVCPGIH